MTLVMVFVRRLQRNMKSGQFHNLGILEHHMIDHLIFTEPYYLYELNSQN